MFHDTSYSRLFSTKIKLKKDVFSSCHERGTKKNSESPRGIEPQNFGFRAPRSGVRLLMGLRIFSLSHARDKT